MNLRQYFFKKYAKKELVKHQSKFISYNDAKTILVLAVHQPDEYATLQQIVRRLEKDGKSIKTCIYSTTPEAIGGQYTNWTVFGKKEVNWLQRPSKSIEQEICSQQYDLLIDLTLTHSLPLTYLASGTQATCKVGMKKPEFSGYNIMIDMDNKSEESPSRQNVADLFEQIIFYLKKIQTTN